MFTEEEGELGKYTVVEAKKQQYISRREWSLLLDKTIVLKVWPQEEASAPRGNFRNTGPRLTESGSLEVGP